MATLGNLLARQGGDAMTPRIVKLTLAIPDKGGGAPRPEVVEVALLPVSLRKQARALRRAETAIADLAQVGEAPNWREELLLQFFLEAMRDPDDLRKAFVEAKNVDTFRDSLIGEQLDVLTAEYKQLLASEYVDVLAYNQAIRSEAKDLFPEGQASQ